MSDMELQTREPETEVVSAPASGKPEKKKKRKSTMRRVKTISPMAMIEPFIMNTRTGSQNLITDRIPVAKLEKYLNLRAHRSPASRPEPLYPRSENLDPG